jgi:hypothetical protein
MEVKKMKKTNVEIAKLVAERGYDYEEALEGIDAGRTPADEEKEITQEELNEMVDAICSSFDCESENC